MAARQALGARHADGGGRCGGERHVKTSLERECHTLQAEHRAVCFSRHKRSILSRKGPDYGWGLGAGQGMCFYPADRTRSSATRRRTQKKVGKRSVRLGRVILGY